MNAEGEEVKIVYIDGNINTGQLRSVRGRIIDDTEATITIIRNDGKITIGKNFLIKIEQWKSGESFNGTKS